MKEIDEMYVHKFRTPELMVVDEQELEAVSYTHLTLPTNSLV